MPQPRGPNVGKFDFHLTYVDSDRRHHETVAAVAPEDFEAPFRRLAEELLAYYLRVVRRVTVADLRRDEFFAVLPSEEMEARAAAFLGAKRAKLRLNQSSFERLGKELELYEPEILDDLAAEMKHEPVMMVSERDAAAIFVGYRPNGLGPDQPPGWYAMPADQSIAEVLENFFTIGLGPAFYEAMTTIARELQMDIDLDKLEQGRARAIASSQLETPQLKPPSG